MSVSGVSKVVIDVEDQDRAKAFWTERMGFDVAQDVAYGDERWLEVRSPDGAVLLVLGRTSSGPGDRAAVSERLPTSNVMFRCTDIAATYRELAGRGVDFPQPPTQLSFGWWSMFADTEGNRFALQPEGQ
jgi:predicted enzyme related to lactoylglutathione lyase